MPDCLPSVAGGGAGQARYTLGSEALRLYLELSDDAAILTSSPTLLLVQVVKPDTTRMGIGE